MKKYHPYHLVEARPWPIIGGCGALFLTCGSILYFHYSHNTIIITGFIVTRIIMITWWRDVIRESSFQGLHTMKVQLGLKQGMILFISSEVLFFFSFFWAFFHRRLAPTIEIGANWPPEGIETLNPTAIPLLNTLTLLSSGITVTWTHHSLITNKKDNASKRLTWTIILGLFFTYLQALEYYNSSFTVIPELSNVSVFSRGMAVGFRVSMPSGGQFAPISIVGASLLWKKAQKKEKKKSTSDEIKSIMPCLSP